MRWLFFFALLFLVQFAVAKRSDTTFLRSAAAVRLPYQIRFYLDDTATGFGSEAFTYYKPGNSRGFVSGEDGVHLGGLINCISSPLPNLSLIQDGQPILSDTARIILKVDAPANLYRFHVDSLHTFDEGTQFFLFHRDANGPGYDSVHHLNTNPEYWVTFPAYERSRGKLTILIIPEFLYIEPPHARPGKHLSFSLWPNPKEGTQILNLQTPGCGANARMTVFDWQGRSLHRADLGDGRTQVALPDGIIAGMYLVKVQAANGGSKTQRLVVR